MYSSLLFFHSIFRWLVLMSLLYAVFRAYRGYTSDRTFTKSDDSIRHWTATISHIQLMIGSTLYFTSPVIKSFFSGFKQNLRYSDLTFFGIIHILLMFTSVVLITIGSALAKRRSSHHEKFKTMMWWFLIALLIIFIAIPWPFSPFACRPYLRTF